ncbi:MAG: DUF1697 domain-containing protein [Actinomycetota bacterium]|nr:DUF1697 domain-containing protein [Actinomycetota bacterium]
MTPTTYVCLLRGINVAGGRKIKMTDLTDLFVALGHTDVSTYIQSGNVVFRAAVVADSAAAGYLAARIEAGIASDLGLAVSVILRTGPDLVKVVEANPFIGTGAEVAKLHVTFLADAPDQARVAQVDPSGFEPDRFAVVGREVYLHCPTGYGRTKLNNAFWERRLRVPATTRNWNTVTTLVRMAGGA